MPTRSGVIRAKRRAIGGRRLRCKKGKSCSAACINRNKYCLVDAPTPVAGALPRAVKAIQSRKEKLGPREKRQALQKRREYVKGKVEQSAKLKQVSSYKKRLNQLRVKLGRAIFLGEDPMRLYELRQKIKRLEEEVGSKLGVAKSKSLDEESLKSKFRDTRQSMIQRVRESYNRMSRASDMGNKALYLKEEDKYLKLVRRTSWFLQSDPSGFANGIVKAFREYKKGDLWAKSTEKRNNERRKKLNSVFDKLEDQAREAAKNGDLKKYQDAERKILKITSRAGDIVNRTEKPTKGSIWKEERVPRALDSLRKSMEEAISSGELSKYNKLESKFLKIRDRFIGNNYGRKNLLFGAYGPSILMGKGEPLARAISKLEMDLSRAAMDRNRREYNKIEGQLLKLKPGETKGRVWKERLEKRVKEYSAKLKYEMELAAARGERSKYNKLERVLLRLDPNAKKGAIWKRERTLNYVPTLLQKMKNAAAEGDRKKYNKLEKVLHKIDPNNPRYEAKGKIWREERVGAVIDKLGKEMEKAALDGDRAKYDRLEERFFRIKDKAGASAIRDAELRYMRRGEMWKEIKGSTSVRELESLLDKGKREGVTDIRVRGGAEEFSVSSRVLGNDLKIMVSPNDTTSFTVNGSYTASDDLPRREQIAIIRESRRQYDEIFKNMDEGTVFMVTAAGGDNRQEMRERGYTDRGFSEPDYNGRMYGMVSRGRIIPIDEDDYNSIRYSNQNDDDDYED